MRQPEKTSSLTPAERVAYAKRLRDAAKVIDALDRQLDGDGWVFRKPSLIDGLRRIEAFTNDLRRTVNLIQSGKNLDRDSTKADLTI